MLKKKEYILTKFNQITGDIKWQTHVVNGGYGTPIVFKNLVFCLNSFDSIAAYNKNNGKYLFNRKFDDRIRSSMNVIDGYIWFSHTSHLIALDENGKIIHDFHVPNAFLYGTVSKYQDELIIIGTKYIQDENTSNKFIWAIDKKNGNKLFEVNLGVGSIISTDTSGFWLQKGYIYASNNDKIFKISAQNGKIVWQRKVNGNVHRHTVIADSQAVYYTTLKGEFGSLKLKNGTVNWKVNIEEGIITPPTVINGSLLIIGDSSIYVVDKKEGLIYQKIPTGHSPYSAATIFRNRVFLGAGEPPINGLLFCFEFNQGVNNNLEISQDFYVGNTLNSKKLQLTIETKNNWDEAIIDPSVLSDAAEIKGQKIGNNIFVFQIPLKNTNINSWYTLSIKLKEKRQIKIVTTAIKIRRTDQLPRKVTLSNFNKIANESTPFNSGSALTQMIEEEYGKKISQEDFRDIIDYLKKTSKWKDADFQTWRLLLKRALSSPAKDLNEFIKLEDENDGHPE
ncbi:outer membrane protein assembly factor BamB family protein [Lactobacillus helveticus]|uniref:outer membrane protein assembly factor BamB family protein n=1 Tax=Lactobacillus helveticus TaxID=1587 RepID=UPI001562578F